MTSSSPAIPTTQTLQFDADSLEQLITACPLPDWVAKKRRKALTAAAGLGLPDRRSENWMRTDLRLFKPAQWGLSTSDAKEQPVDGLLLDAIRKSSHGSLAGRLVSIDGHVRREEFDSKIRSNGVLFGSAEQLLAEHGDVFVDHWFSTLDAEEDWFAAIHGAFHRASTILYVPSGVKILEPFSVMSALSDGGVDTSHVLVVLGDGAEATLLTETSGGGHSGASGGFHCGGTEIIVGRHALLRLVNLQNWNRGVWHFAKQKAVVHEAGKIQWTLGALGSRLSQVAQDVVLAGKHAEAQVNGVMFTEDRQQLVYNTLQHHSAPSCRSDLLYKGALQDRSRLVWRGMIKVDKSAQKTDGYQRNDTLMLSNESRSDSIPGLEIEADDVRCTHGATSGRVDHEQIFYAQSRGLTADEAARLVVAGFFQQIFDRITIPPVRDALAQAVGSRIRRVS